MLDSNWVYLFCPETSCRISVTFVINASEEKTIKVPIGQSMLEAAHENDIDLEGELNIFIL